MASAKTPKLHLRSGGSRGYSIEIQEANIWSHQNGYPTISSTRSVFASLPDDW